MGGKTSAGMFIINIYSPEMFISCLFSPHLHTKVQIDSQYSALFMIKKSILRKIKIINEI